MGRLDLLLRCTPLSYSPRSPLLPHPPLLPVPIRSFQPPPQPGARAQLPLTCDASKPNRCWQGVSLLTAVMMPSELTLSRSRRSVTAASMLELQRAVGGRRRIAVIAGQAGGGKRNGTTPYDNKGVRGLQLRGTRDPGPHNQPRGVRGPGQIFPCAQSVVGIPQPGHFACPGHGSRPAMPPLDPLTPSSPVPHPSSRATTAVPFLPRRPPPPRGPPPLSHSLRHPDDV